MRQFQTPRYVVWFVLSFTLIGTPALAVIGGQPLSIPSAIYIPEVNCSGVVIGKNKILLAGHCVITSFKTRPHLHRERLITVLGHEGSVYNSGGQEFKVRVLEAAAHPSWLRSLQIHIDSNGAADSRVLDLAADDPQALDIGVVALDQELPLTQALLPSLTEPLPKKAYISGRGCEVRGANPGHVLPPYKGALVDIQKSGSFKIESGTLDLVSNQKAGSCRGDSGAGLFAADTKGDLQKPSKVFGIQSTLKAPFSEDVMPGILIDLRNAELQDWIQKTANIKALSIAKDIKPQSMDDELKEFTGLLNVKNKVLARTVRKIKSLLVKDPTMACYGQMNEQKEFEAPELQVFVEALLNEKDPSQLPSRIREGLFKAGAIRPCDGEL